MKPRFILIGYADTNGTEKPSLVGSLDAPDAELAAIFHAAKHDHQFPEGVKCLEFFNLVEPSERAVFIRPDLADEIKGRKQTRLAALETKLKKDAEKQELQQAIAAAHEKLRKAAVAHNSASAALQNGKNRLLDAEANFKATNTDSHKAELEAAKEKVAILIDLEAKAAKALDAAKKAKAKLLAEKN